jgi:hypothetical protein
MGAGLASEALSEADAALGVLDGIGGQSTRKAELLLVAARAARNAVRPLSRTGSAGRPAAAPALRRSGAPSAAATLLAPVRRGAGVSDCQAAVGPAVETERSTAEGELYLRELVYYLRELVYSRVATVRRAESHSVYGLSRSPCSFSISATIPGTVSCSEATRE